MERSDILLEDLSDDDDNVAWTIQLQKKLISESQSIANRQVELPPQDSEGSVSYIGSQIDTRSTVKDDENVYHDALAANVEYDNYLARLETNLKRLISECKSNLKEVSNTLGSFCQEKKKYSPSDRSTSLYTFGAPYFKDKDYYRCPPNDDTVKKKRNNELLLIDLPPIRFWSSLHIKQIVDAITDSALQACIKDAQNEKNALIRRCNALAEDDAERTKLQDDIKSLDVNKISQTQLKEKIASMDHDWLKLSASTLNGKRTAGECRGLWYNYLHPKFYKGKWTAEEEEKLIQLAEENNFQNWDLIAEKLGTSRSAYQCFIHFQSETTELVKRKWTKEEDDLLKAIVERLRVGDYIPWSRVSVNMKNRTRIQVYNRWSYSLNPKVRKGKFTLMEDIIILRGIQKYGEDFQKIASFMPDRTAPQIRIRYRSGLSKKDFAPWTLAEDQSVLDLVKQHGHDWTKIAKHLPGKLSVQIRRRYDTLLKWIELHPGKEITEMSRRSSLKTSIYDSHPEYWAYAEKLFSSSGNPKALTTSLYTIKWVGQQPSKSRPQVVSRHKKRSLIDDKLCEYFQRFYPVKPRSSTKKFTTLSDCEAKLISDVASFLEILGAKLNIPPDDELDQDNTLNDEDKQVLKGLRTFHPRVLEDGSYLGLRSEATPQPVVEENTVTEEDSPPVVVDPINLSIDDVPKSDPSSTHQEQLQLEFNSDFDKAVMLEHAPVEPNAPVILQQEHATYEPAHPLFGDLKYLCPPNISTLVGLRSILLGKHRFVESISRQDTDSVLPDINSNKDISFQRASQLWEDRLMCLLALPNFLTKLKPVEAQGSPGSAGGLPSLSGISPDSDCQIEAVPGTSGVFNAPVLSDKDGLLHPPQRKRKAPPAKKKKTTKK